MTNVKTPTNAIVTCTDADTQYPYTIPDNCVYITFQARTAVDIRFAFITGKVATPTDPYVTLKSGMAYNSPEGGMFASGSILYLAADAPGIIVEIVAYTQPKIG